MLEVTMLGMLAMGIAFWWYWPATYLLERKMRVKQQDWPVTSVSEVVYYQVLSVSALTLSFFVIPIFLVAIVLGCVGWIVIGVNRAGSIGENRRLARERPLPKMQVRMKDLLLATFFAGGCMALAWVYSTDMTQPISPFFLPACSGYFILASMASLLISADLARRDPYYHLPNNRTTEQVMLHMVVAATGIIPVLLTHAAWRAVLDEHRLKTWRRDTNDSEA